MLFISLSAGFMLATAGHYALRLALKDKPSKEARYG